MKRPASPKDALALPPDPVIEAYKDGVDRTLIRENLRLTPDQRVRKMLRFREAVSEIRGAARRAVPSLRRLIEVKRAAGRPKDLEAIAELEEILRESGSE